MTSSLKYFNIIMLMLLKFFPTDQACTTMLQGPLLDEDPELVEAACRRVKAGKADGPDRVPSEVCKFYPKETAKLLYGLLLKLVTHGHEPLIHKGGTVVPIWKGKLAKDTCAAFRSILL